MPIGVGIGIGVTSLPMPSNATWLITSGITGLTLSGMLDEPAWRAPAGVRQALVKWRGLLCRAHPMIGSKAFNCSCPDSDAIVIALQGNCVEVIQANHELLAKRVAESATLVTALHLIIGYEKAAPIVKTASAELAFTPSWK